LITSRLRKHSSRVFIFETAGSRTSDLDYWFYEDIKKYLQSRRSPAKPKGEKAKSAASNTKMQPSREELAKYRKYLLGLSAKIEELEIINTAQSEAAFEKNAWKAIPKEIGRFTNLESLDLQGHMFPELPEEIGKLTRLTYLNIDSQRLKTLPKSIGRLENLEILSLEYCPCLERLPEEMGKLSQLRQLSLDSSINFKKFPKSLNKLKNLKYINLERIKDRKILAKELRQLLDHHCKIVV